MCETILVEGFQTNGWSPRVYVTEQSDATKRVPSVGRERKECLQTTHLGTCSVLFRSGLSLCRSLLKKLDVFSFGQFVLQFSLFCKLVQSLV